MTILSSRRANVNLNSGGGDKKQGLAPKATFFFKAPFTGRQYSTDSGDGSNRFKLVCMNQLGGIGRGRSQFGVNADGINCSDKQDNLEKFRRYLFEINHYIQTVLLPAAINSEGVSNEFSNYELCLVGNRESLISDICSNNSGAYNIISSHGFGTGSQNVIFTHLLTTPLSEGADDVSNPLSITYWNNDGWTNTTLNFDLLQSIQDKINFCNNYLITIRPNLFITGQYPMNTLGTHTLGLINNNILFDGTSATSFLQNLYPKTFGNSQLFYSNSPLTNNSINIFKGTDLLQKNQISALSVSTGNGNSIIQIRLNKQNITKLSTLDVTKPSDLISFTMTFYRRAYNNYHNRNFSEYDVDKDYIISDAYYNDTTQNPAMNIDSFTLYEYTQSYTINIQVTNTQDDIDELASLSDHNIPYNEVPHVVITLNRQS